jgi:anhydro-N-acetylmuramic acid kinase
MPNAIEQAAQSSLYIGLMSGTSLDGVDGVLVDFSQGTRVLQHASCGFDAALRAELLALNTAGGQDELHRAALAANALVRHYAQVVQQLLTAAGVQAGQIAAIGAHGQTVRHRPQMFDGTGYTLQLNSPALLAELTGITVVADLRSRDVAAGGQGAPLVPAFHQSVFGKPGNSPGAQYRRHCQSQRAGCRRLGAGLRYRHRQCADGRLVPAPYRQEL